MESLSDLYQEVIVDHSSRPRNFGKMEHADRTVEGFNPLCGDKISLYVTLDHEVIKDIGFEGQGCAISKASASMMTVALKGKTRSDAQDLFHRFQQMVMTGEFQEEKVGNLVAFSGVHKFPARVKCAILSWHAMSSALQEKPETVVSTE